MKENKLFERGIALFNAGQFFEAHEAWEELWLAEPEPNKTFLQGLIQIAAAFHHHGRGNARGRKSLLAAGIARLEKFPADHGGLALAELRAEANLWASAEARSQSGDRHKLPQIRPAKPSGGGGNSATTLKNKRSG